MLKQLSEKELDDVKEGLKILKQRDDVEIFKNEVNRNWNEIMTQQNMFDRYENEAFAIEDINIDQLIECFEMYTRKSNFFKKLSVHVIGTPKLQSVSR